MQMSFGDLDMSISHGNAKAYQNKIDELNDLIIKDQDMLLRYR